MNPPNRFERVPYAADGEHLAANEACLGRYSIATEFLPDESKSLIVETDSPDIPFRYSINPYRGCEHGCAYFLLSMQQRGQAGSGRIQGARYARRSSWVASASPVTCRVFGS